MDTLPHPFCLIVPSDNTEPSTSPERVPEVVITDQSTKPGPAASEEKSNWRSTAVAAAKLLLRGVRDSADAFGPLKSVAGGLCFVLDNYEVRLALWNAHPRCSQAPQRTKANIEAIQSLAPRVEALAESLCKPVSQGDVRERERRQKLEE